MVQAPSRLAPTRNLAGRAEAQPSGAPGRWLTPASSRRHARLRRRSAVPVAPHPESPDRHLFCRLGRACRKPESVRSRFGEVKVRPRSMPIFSALPFAPFPTPRSATPRPRWSRCVPTAGSSRWSAARATRPRPFNRATQARRQPGQRLQAVRLSRRPACRLYARRHDRGLARSPSTAGRPPTATASIAARSPCERPLRAPATPPRCAFRNGSGATMSCAPRANSGFALPCPIRPASRSAPRVSA